MGTRNKKKKSKKKTNKRERKIARKSSSSAATATTATTTAVQIDDGDKDKGGRSTKRSRTSSSTSSSSSSNANICSYPGCSNTKNLRRCPSGTFQKEYGRKEDMEQFRCCGIQMFCHFCAMEWTGENEVPATDPSVCYACVSQAYR